MRKHNKEFNAAQKYARAIQDLFQNSNIYLFGSYAKDCPKKTSDIDIGIIVDDLRQYPKMDYIKKDMILASKTLDYDSRLEPHIVGRKQDVSGFCKEIETTGIQLV